MLPTEPSSKIAAVYQAMGWLYEDQNQLQTALGYHQKALLTLEALPTESPQAVVDVYQAMGRLYEEENQQAKALECHQKALAILGVLHTESHPELAVAYKTIAWLYEDHKQYPEALSYHQRTLLVLQDLYAEAHPAVAAAYQAIADLYAAVQNQKEAQYYYNKACMLRTTLYGKQALSSVQATKYLCEALMMEGAPVQLRLARLEQALAQGANINGVNAASPGEQDRFTLLSLAALEGHPELCKFLLFHGANVNGSSKEHVSPLINAAIQGYYNICKILLSRGAKVNAKDHEGFTALMAAARENRHQICQLLIDYGAHVNEVDINGDSALTITLVLRGYSATAEVFIAQGAHLDEALMSLAIAREDLGLCAYLLDCGIPLPKQIQTTDVAILGLLQRYQILTPAIDAITTPQSLIHFIQEKKQRGDIYAIKRALSLRLGPLSYLRKLAENDQDFESFHEHLRQFAIWVQLNPYLVGRSAVDNTQVLALFSNYLWELFQKKPLKNLRIFDIQQHLEQACGLPLELTQIIWHMSRLGMAIPFHHDLVKQQVALQQSPDFPREDFAQRKYRQLIWRLEPVFREPPDTRMSPSEPLLFSATPPQLQTQLTIQEDAKALGIPVESLAMANRAEIHLSQKRKRAFQ